MTNALIFILPFCIAYALMRAYMHHRAGRKMWMIQMIILATFMACVLGFELWMTYAGKN